MNYYNATVASLKALSLQHKLALLATTAFMGAAIAWQPSTSMLSPLSIHKQIEIPLVIDRHILSDENSEPLGAAVDQNDPEFQAPKDELDQELVKAKADVEYKHRVVSGETLGLIFSQYGLHVSDMYRLIAANKSVQQLNVGQILEWEVNPSGDLTQLTIIRSKKLTDVYTLTKHGYVYKELAQKGVVKPITLIGKVSGSFYNSAREAGLTPVQINAVVKALQWRINLGRDARKGDSFGVSLDREFIDGKPIGKGKVNAFYYKSQMSGRSILIVRAEDDEFYDQNARSLNRGFRRIPMHKRYRISSSFNGNRLHPITKRRSPHNGTDFAVPVGTPIIAAGEGVVVKSRYHPLAGNYVVIKHGREYMTRYLHLSKRHVKVGDRVKTGQVIAKSGNTGRSTGPHLHFELIKNGRPVDAMKIALPQAEPLKGKERSQFMRQVKAYEQQIKTKMAG